MNTTAAVSTPQPSSRPIWRRLIGFNLLTAVLLGVGGYYLGWFIGHQINGNSFSYEKKSSESDVSLLLAYVFGVIGFLIGLGFANYPFSRLLGRPASLREKEEQGWGRYFGLCTDHKVVGIQYLIGIGVFIFIGGLNAMLIRTELLHQTPTVVGPNQYLSLVGMHGTMMMGMMTSGILGPFANYFVPLMIGARRMAFPRIEALTFWLLMAAGFILVSTIFFGGFPTGWTGYEPLNDQAVMGMDSYIVFFALVGISMCLLGLNMMATIITMRAPGLTWSRLPIFVWSVFATAVLMVLAAPMLVATLSMAALDRTINTSFFVSGGGGSSYLFENLFWFFGHPEVYILALPGFGIILELLPVFTRKPLWGYRLAVAGMLGVSLMSFFVWQHHLFVSGINADLRPFYMLSTEIISIPTGFIFLCVMGTLWRGRASFTVPMLFCLGWTFNFLIGGLSGVFLSDAPADTTLHGSFFSMAHFHYTIMGGLIFAFFAGIYYWVPKMVGLRFNERLAKVHFWLMFIAFNSTFMPLFAVGLEGQPRRVSEYAPNLHGLNTWVSISAFVLGFSMLIFVYNVVQSLIFVREPAEQNPWHSKSIEWQLPTPVPVNNFERIPVFDSDPYDYGVPQLPLGGTQTASAGALTMASEGESRPLGMMVPAVPAGVEIPPEPADVGARALSVSARLLAGATIFFFLAFVFAYFYLRSINQNHFWLPSAEQLKEQKEIHVSLKPNQALGAVFVGCLALSVLSLIAAGRQMKRRARSGVPAIAGLVLGLGAVGAQCVEFVAQKFGPTHGAFASVFCAWLGFYLIAVMATMYWLETQIATELRARRVPAHRLDDETGADIADADSLIAPSLDAAVFYWSFLGALGVLAYVVLYLL